MPGYMAAASATILEQAWRIWWLHNPPSLQEKLVPRKYTFYSTICRQNDLGYAFHSKQIKKAIPEVKLNTVKIHRKAMKLS